MPGSQPIMESQSFNVYICTNVYGKQLIFFFLSGGYIQKNIQSLSIKLDEFSQKHICEINTQIKKHNIITALWTPSLKSSTSLQR